MMSVSYFFLAILSGTPNFQFVLRRGLSLKYLTFATVVVTSLAKLKKTDIFTPIRKNQTDGAMGCICFVNKAMGIYFIEDLDGYWIEIIPPQLAPQA